MFSFKSKSDQAASTDKVWRTKAACLKGVATEALLAIRNSQTPVVFSFFDEPRQKFVQFLESNTMAYGVLDSGQIAHVTMDQAKVFVVQAFTHEVMDWLTRRSNGSPLKLMFLGHYPIPGPENQVIENLVQHLGPIPIVFFLSLEDPLLENFGAERINPLMETLGMGPDECIEHAMVSKAIFNARKKLEEKVKTEMKTKTESEWFVKNIKTMQ